MYYGLVSYRNRIGMRFSNKEYGLLIIILILLVKIAYQIEHSIQNIRCKQYSNDNSRTGIALEEVLID